MPARVFRLRSLYAMAIAAALVPTSKHLHASEPPAQGFASPQEVFAAYRKAIDDRNWRAAFLVMSPEAQEVETVDAFNMTIWKGGEEGKKVGAVQKKFGLSERAFESAYADAYLKKHGVDLFAAVGGKEKHFAELDRAEEVAEPADPNAPGPQPALVAGPPDAAPAPVPPLDEELYYSTQRELVKERVKDRLAYYAETMSVLYPKEVDMIDIGHLEQLQVNGDTATGRVKLTGLSHIGTDPNTGGLERKFYTSHPGTVHFRRINGKWFFHGVEQDPVMNVGPPVIGPAPAP